MINNKLGILLVIHIFTYDRGSLTVVRFPGGGGGDVCKAPEFPDC